MSTEKFCLVCGKPLGPRQTKYCSKKCMGLGKQHYGICIVCGKKFKKSPSSAVLCCSPECSYIHRSILHKSGVYSMDSIHEGFSRKMQELGPENHWGAKHWVIQSPDGNVYECDNLLNFIRTHPELFGDCPPRRVFDGFAKIKSSMMGKRKKPSYSWRGWKLISWSDEKNTPER